MSRISAGELLVSFRNVGKSYRLWRRPQDRLKQSLFARFGRSYGRVFWALQNISAEIAAGESVGIVGRNGSGKSTLLELIAGTVAPTVGEVTVRGRVAALLELGSGFNAEFTGRENVYLNGCILGIREEEMAERFPEIAAFADIGDFMDQPVKVYSSGMIMRLAFAVQAFVEKDILIVDEALSVGDEAFQRKCMARLEQFRGQGGTLLLVSHYSQSIVQNCERCLLLQAGQLIADGPSKEVTDLYQRLMYTPPAEVPRLVADFARRGLRTGAIAMDVEPAPAVASAPRAVEPREWFDPAFPASPEVKYGTGGAEILEYGLRNETGERVNVVVAGRAYRWAYTVVFHQDARDVTFGMMLKTVEGLDVAGLSSDRDRVRFDRIAAGSVFEARFDFRMNVVPGAYFLNSGVGAQVDGQFAYLTRRVDVCMVRVLAADDRPRWGIAEVEHRFSFVEVGR